MSTQSTRDSRSRCVSCSSYLESTQKECCLSTCVLFADKLFLPQSTCDCNLFSSESSRGLSRQNACPHFRSTASLPELLDFQFDNNEKVVVSRVGIPVRSVFGPLIASSEPGSAYPESKYSLCANGLWTDFCLESDYNTNWIKFVRDAEDPTEQNLAAFQFDSKIYFAVIREISPGEELRVRKADNYAISMTEALLKSYQVGSSFPNKKSTGSSSSKKPSCFGLHSILKPKAMLIRTSNVETENEPEVEETLGKKPKSGTVRFLTPSNPNGFKRAKIDVPEIQTGMRNRGYQCVICGKMFRNSKDLCLHHQFKHLEDGMYTCPKCPKMFKEYERMSAHFKESHGRRMTCELCGFSVPAVAPDRFVAHVRSHQTNSSLYKFKCPHCVMEFRLKPHLRDHQVENKGRPDHAYLCDLCDVRSISQSGLTLHKLHVHLIRKEKSNRTNPNPNEKMSETGNGILETTDPASKLDPANSDSDEEAEITPTGSDSENRDKFIEERTALIAEMLKSSTNTRNGGKAKESRKEAKAPWKISCIYCNQSFSSTLLLSSHHKAHHQINGEYPCTDCPKLFKDYEKASSHIRGSHRLGKNDGLFGFGSTPSMAGQLNYIVSHNRNISSNFAPEGSESTSGHAEMDDGVLNENSSFPVGETDFPYAGPSCFFCPVKFENEDALEDHQLSHTVDGNYRCFKCREMFPIVADLREHLESVHASALPVQTLEETPSADRRNLKTSEHTRDERQSGDHVEPTSSSNENIRSRKQSMPEAFTRCFFKCRECRLGFPQRTALLSHLTSVHPETSPSTIPELNLPLKKVQGYRCKICMNFSENEVLAEVHLGTHSPEDKAALALDGKYVGSNSVGACFKRCGLEMYSCTECGSLFRKAKDLWYHAKLEHPEYYKTFGMLGVQ